METTPPITIFQPPRVLPGVFPPQRETGVGVEISRPCTPESRPVSTEANALQRQGSPSCLHQDYYQLKSMSCAKVSFMGVNIPNTCELPRSSGFPTVSYSAVLAG